MSQQEEHLAQALGRQGIQESIRRPAGDSGLLLSGSLLRPDSRPQPSASCRSGYLRKNLCAEAARAGGQQDQRKPGRGAPPKKPAAPRPPALLAVGCV